jgi:hypothetical protein
MSMIVYYKYAYNMHVITHVNNQVSQSIMTQLSSRLLQVRWVIYIYNAKCVITDITIQLSL